VKHRLKFKKSEGAVIFQPLVSFEDSPETSGRKLFEKVHKDELVTSARDDTTTNAAAAYQTALRQRYDALTKDEKAEWEQKAAAEGECAESYQADHIFTYAPPSS
jgi:hypothetical protein